MNAYADVLRIPGAAPSCFVAFLARLPLSMSALGIVFLVQDQTDSYRTAGIVAAAYIVAAAISGPIQGRVSDRIGQRTVLLVAVALLVTGLAALIQVVDTDAALIHMAPVAMFAGLGAPQAGSFIRARWSSLLSDRPDRLQTAFALEAVVDELVFISGPILVTLIATTISPSTGLITAGALGLVGSIALAAQGRTEPARSSGSTGPRPPIGFLLVFTIVVVGIGIGTLFGATEVAVVAFTTERDVRHLAGFVLAAWAFGSLLAGVLVGSMRPPPSQLRRLQSTLVLLGLTFTPLLFIDSVTLLAIALFIGGFMIAPALIAAMSLIQANVPPARLTEGITWASTGLAVGVAPGAALAGVIVDEWGASAAFALPLGAGLMAAVAALIAVPPALRNLQRRNAVSV